MSMVYIVDDEALIAADVVDLVGSVGLAAQAFGAGREFLEAFNPSAPGCVVLDLRLPDIGGLDILREFERRGYKTPVILLTGHADVDSAVLAMKIGAADVIQKPFNRQLLLDRILQLLRRDEERHTRSASDGEIKGRLNRLSQREREVLSLVSAGHSTRQIANELGITATTVAIHRNNLMRKMEAESLADLLRMAMICGFSNGVDAGGHADAPAAPAGSSQPRRPH